MHTARSGDLKDLAAYCPLTYHTHPEGLCRPLGCFRRTPHPVIVTTRDNRDHIRVLLYSDYTTITGWGGPPSVFPFSATPPPPLCNIDFFEWLYRPTKGSCSLAKVAYGTVLERPPDVQRLFLDSHRKALSGFRV